MSLNNLRNYNWEQGTLSNPVSLTGTQFSWLINLLKKGTITKDIRGYIQIGSPITSYEKYLVELVKDEYNQPLLHLVNPTVIPVEYTVVPQTSTIKEGTSTKLNINGIGLEALKFRIINHTNTTPDYQARTTIDAELGYVRVASAQENATWTDVVTIQVCPIWEEWTDQNASIVEFDITVNAQAVTSVTITAPQNVKPGSTFNPIVNFLPVGHTKPIVNTLEDAAAKRGICFIPTSDDFTVGKTTDPAKMSAIAPNIETPVGETWSLGCGVYAFTSAQTMATPSVNVTVKYPYVQFILTTNGTFSDISTANPNITLQKVDSQNTPIGEPIVLTGSVSDSSLVYTYGNGLIAGDGSEIYKVTFDEAPEGYRNIAQMTITPNQIETLINVQYVVKVPDIYQVYADGDYETIQAVIDRGRLKAKATVGVALVDDNCSLIITLNSSDILSLSSSPLASEDTDNVIPKISVRGSAEYVYDGNAETTALCAISTGDSTLGVNVARSRTITINNVAYNGYIPSLYELLLIWNNKETILNYASSILQISNPSLGAANMMTSILYDAHKGWSIWWPNRGVGNQTYHSTASNNNTLVIYPFSHD